MIGAEAVAPQGFAAACQALGSPCDERDLTAAARDLLERWAEASRAYHDTEHLSEVLQRLVELGASTPVTVLAAWFHDAVYTGAPGVDERASAALAGEVLGRLGVAGQAVQQVQALVLATVDHTNEMRCDDTELAALRRAFLDADLAILAAPPERYARYLDGVREEYRHVDDDKFAAGRLAVLERLRRAGVFGTPAAQRRWGAAAEANLSREITVLGARLRR